MPYLHVTSYYGRRSTHQTNFTYIGDAWNEWEDSKGRVKGYFFVLTKLYEPVVADDGLSMYMWNRDTGDIEYEGFLSESPTPDDTQLDQHS